MRLPIHFSGVASKLTYKKTDAKRKMCLLLGFFPHHAARMEHVAGISLPIMPLENKWCTGTCQVIRSSCDKAARTTPWHHAGNTKLFFSWIFLLLYETNYLFRKIKSIGKTPKDRFIVTPCLGHSCSVNHFIGILYCSQWGKMLFGLFCIFFFGCST